MMLEVPEGWSGELLAGFVPAAIEGTGRFSVRGQTFAIGSVEALTTLSNLNDSFGPLAIVEANTPIRVIVLVNPALARVLPTNDVIMEGFNIGGIEVDVEPLAANARLQDN